jgi:hypothetical protein
MNTQTKKILQIILSVVMIISIFLPWWGSTQSGQVNVSGSYSMGGESGNVSYGANVGNITLSGINNIQMVPGIIILIVSVISLVLIFTKFQFLNSVLGTLNFVIGIIVLLTFKSSLSSQLNSNGYSVDMSSLVTPEFGLYLLLIGSIIFSILSYDKRLLSLFSEKLSSTIPSNIVSDIKISTTTENKSEVKYCPNCGKPSPIQSSFCSSCGKSF